SLVIHNSACIFNANELAMCEGIIAVIAANHRKATPCASTAVNVPVESNTLESNPGGAGKRYDIVISVGGRVIYNYFRTITALAHESDRAGGRCPVYMADSKV